MNCTLCNNIHLMNFNTLNNFCGKLDIFHSLHNILLHNYKLISKIRLLFHLFMNYQHLDNNLQDKKYKNYQNYFLDKLDIQKNIKYTNSGPNLKSQYNSLSNHILKYIFPKNLFLLPVKGRIHLYIGYNSLLGYLNKKCNSNCKKCRECYSNSIHFLYHKVRNNFHLNIQGLKVVNKILNHTLNKLYCLCTKYILIHISCMSNLDYNMLIKDKHLHTIPLMD